MQRLIHKTTDYRESGLDNLQLVDARIWECGNGHEEIEIPHAEQLHQLLTSLLIRKPALLRGPEIRFLRKELGLSGRAFAERLGLTPEHLSRLETGGRSITSTIDLLVRLAVGWELTRRERIEFPRDVAPSVTRIEAAPDAELHRVRHCEDAPRERRWASVSV
ncbi:MAG: helix-turn-helix domain-containing protein [Acidobacteria bacterium]|nr:helix-turn-helix domain-containing protein [Acidobacteriota bacterium]